MNINKAIKKQNVAFKKFIIFMCLIFILLPILLLLSGQMKIFFFIYLAIIEILCLMAIIIKTSNEILVYEIDAYKVKIKIGLPAKDINILSEKVDIILTEGTGKDMVIILITKSKFRNKHIKKIDIDFLKSYPYAGYHYGRLKRLFPENEYFYLVIKNGGYKKYPLLNDLYKFCTHAMLSEETIEQIKIYRNT